ncbi:MAG: AsmA-like C-terminal region-containing protein [Candidatus Methylomirabilales bacterium]
MRVTTWAHRVFLVIGVLVGLVLLVAGSLSLLLRTTYVQERIRSRIQSELQAQLGREVRVGPVRLGLFLRSLYVEEVAVASGDPPREGALFEIERVQLYPDLGQLLRLRLRLHRVVLRRPTLRVAVPLTLGAPTVPPAAPATPVGLAIPLALPAGVEHLEIWDGSVTVQRAEMQMVLAGLDAVLQAPRGEIAASLRIRETTVQTGATSVLLRDLILLAWVEERDIHIGQLLLAAPGANLQAQGRVRSFRTDPAFDLTARIRGELGELPVAFRGLLQGSFVVEGKVTGPPEDPRFIADVAVTGGQVKQLVLSQLTAQILASREGLRVQELKLETADGSLTGNFALDWERFRYRLLLRGERVDVGQTLRLFAGKAPVGGKATVEVEATGEGPDVAALQGRAEVQVEQFHLTNRPGEQGRAQFTLEGGDGHVLVRRLEVQIAPSVLRAEGRVERSGELDLRVQARFPQVERAGRLVGAEPHELAGRATFVGRLTGPLTDPVLRGSLDWTEGRLLGVALASVRGPVELAFARRTLTASPLTVRRGKLSGDLRVGLFLSPKPPDRKIRLIHDLDLDIGGTVRGPLEEFLGVFVRGPVPLAGGMRLSARIRGRPKALRAEGTLALRTVVILDEPWERGHAAVRLQQEKVFLEGLELRRGRERVRGRFEIGFNGASRFELTSTPLAIERLVLLRDSKLMGTVQALAVRGDGPIARPRVVADLKVGGLAYRGVPLGRGRASMTWDGLQDRLTGLLDLPERGYTLRGRLATSAFPLYDGRLTLKDGDLGSLFRIIGDQPRHLSGVGSGSIEFGGRLGEGTPERATVELAAARFSIQGHALQARGPVRLVFGQGRLTILELKLGGEGGEVTVRGQVGEEMDLKISGAVPAILAGSFFPEVVDTSGILETQLTIQGPRGLPRYRGTVRSSGVSLSVRGHPEPFEQIQGEIRFADTLVRATNLTAGWGGGLVAATLQGELKRHGWRWRFQFVLEEGRAERICVTGPRSEATPLVTGQLRASGVLFAGGREGFLASLDGRLRIEMVKGRLQRSSMFVKALTAINITGLFTKGPEGEGIPYDEVSATYDLKKGVAETTNLRLRSPAIRAGGVGQIDLPRDTVDMLLAIQPLHLADKIIKGISELPIIKQLGIGTFLFGKDKSVFVMSARVHGPLGDPAVTVVPSESLQRGVLGIFKRILELPGDLSPGDQRSPEGKRSGPTPEPSD